MSNARLTLLTDGQAVTSDVWHLAGDQLAAIREYPHNEGDSFFDLTLRRSAVFAHRAARRHGLIGSDVTFDRFTDELLVDFQISKASDDVDPLESSEPEPQGSSSQ